MGEIYKGGLKKMARRYIFFTNTQNEGIKKHTIRAETAKLAYEILKESGYSPEEITISGYKEGGV